MNIEGLKQRFHELGAQREAIVSASAPANAVRDAIRDRVNQLERIGKAITAEIKRIEAPVFEIDMERGRLVRALQGKTGNAPKSKGQTMNADEIKALIASLGIDKDVTFNVIGGDKAAPAAPVVPDARIDGLVAQMSALEQRLAALPTTPMAPMADQQTREAFEAISRDVASVAKAVQIHDETINGIKESLGSFVALLKDAR